MENSYATYRIVRADVTRDGTSSLAHYGVLGMKWGVRRTPKQLGRHTIKKGTKMYRTTVDANESTKGSTYVTYLPPDRDLYRIWDGSRGEMQLYEKQYKLSKDLNVPSRKELTDVVYDVIKKDVDNKFLKEVGDVRSDWFLTRDVVLDYWRKISPDVQRKIRNENDHNDEKIYLAVKDIIKSTPGYKSMASEFIETVSKLPAHDVMAVTTAYFGSATKTRQAVIDELKKRGYNAMVDEAGVGGKQLMRNREGVEPLIIFDQADTLTPITTKLVDKKTKEQAERRHRNWYTVANFYNKKNNQW